MNLFKLSIKKRFLKAIHDEDERLKLLKIAKSVNMDVQQITLNIVEDLSKPKEDDMLMMAPQLSQSMLNKSEYPTFRSGQLTDVILN